jgi:hypothetical protein
VPGHRLHVSRMRHGSRNRHVLGQPTDMRNVRFGLCVQHDQLPGLRLWACHCVHGQSIPLRELCDVPERLLRHSNRHVDRLLRRMYIHRELHRVVLRPAVRVLLQHHSGRLYGQRLHLE